MGRENSDEAYVLALYDSVLDEIGLRQHKFDWLRGDASETGRQVRLPVDGYWPKANVVVSTEKSSTPVSLCVQQALKARGD